MLPCFPSTVFHIDFLNDSIEGIRCQIIYLAKAVLSVRTYLNTELTWPIIHSSHWYLCLVILFHSDCIACQRLNRRTVHISSFLGKRMSPEIEMNSLLLYTLCTHSAPLLVWMPESLQEEYCFAEVISENRTRRRITNFNDWALFSEIQIRKERTYLRIFSGDG